MPMTMTMRLSIITIGLNNRAGFEKTASSIISQKSIPDSSVEWIIIDGASTDGSVESVRNAVRILNNIHPELSVLWQSEPDNGIYNAMNKGVRLAKGEYLLFLNSGDCLYDEYVIENTLPFLTGEDVYVGDIMTDHNGTNELYEFPRLLTPETVLNQMVFKWIPHQSCFIRKELFDRFGLYREDLKIASDGFFIYQSIVLGGASIKNIPMIIAIYDGGGISSRNIDDAMNERSSAHETLPCENVLYCFYRDNYDIVTAFYDNIFGRFIMRAYFFIYRKVISRK